MSDGRSSNRRSCSRIHIELSVAGAAWSSLDNLAELAEAAIAESISQTRVDIEPGAELSILFCGDDFIRALNRQWRGCDAPTNVLAFPAPRGAAALGDIAIAYEAAAREAEAEGKTLKDHVIHLLVHGFLHLVGYDHENDAEAAEMERLESAILAALSIADPYGERIGLLQ